MRVAIDMPKASYEMESGVVHAWRRQVGEAVSVHEIVAEVESEKMIVEVEAPATGTLVEVVHGAGAEVPVRTPIGWLETGD